MNQGAGAVRDDAGLPDGLLSAPHMQEPEGQGPVGEGAEPPGPAAGPEAGSAGAKGQAFRKMRGGGLLPWLRSDGQAPDIAGAGGFGEPGAGDRPLVRVRRSRPAAPTRDRPAPQGPQVPTAAVSPKAALRRPPPAFRSGFAPLPLSRPPVRTRTPPCGRTMRPLPEIPSPARTGP